VFRFTVGVIFLSSASGTSAGVSHRGVRWRAVPNWATASLSINHLKERSMKRLMLFVLLAASGLAQAGIPLVNATCPGNIEVHADKGGPIYINGKEGKLKKFNENYFEAKGSGVTISLSINPDGSPSVSYTGKNRANGICQVKE
jgi:hypothetical protein